MSTPRVKLNAVTFCINEKPINSLLWCDRVPKGKRNKPAKINGVQHHEIAPASRSEISNAVEHSYYVPVQ